jgi:acetyl-CoA carboxylase biotin carboxyl carrier protein
MAPRDGDERGSSILDDVTDAVRELVDVMRSHGLTELDVTSGAVSIRLRAPKGSATAKTPAAVTGSPASPPVIAGPSTDHIITAPMIGTFYASPAPGEQPFVGEGDLIHAGQTVGIIEAMKIMNEIVADRSGTVVEILVRNAQAVEYGSPLFRLDLEKDAGE